MQMTTATNACAANHPECKNECPGYGSQTVCPPLIVLAVLSTARSDNRPPST